VKREQLEHLIRASTEIIGQDSIYVFGSQSILGTWDEDELPPATTLSREADLAATRRSDSDIERDRIEAHLGEGSTFDATYGFHADGETDELPVLPDDWRTRLVPIKNDNTAGRTGYCLDPYDLCVAKLAANREKDRVFVKALIDDGKIQPDKLNRRIKAVRQDRLNDERKHIAQTFIAAVARDRDRAAQARFTPPTTPPPPPLGRRPHGPSM
jgi:hypothetical protein